MNYIVSKERLLELLKAESELNVLEGCGVDNWTWYMECRRQCLKEGAEMYGVNIDDNEDFNFEDLAELDLQNFEKI